MAMITDLLAAVGAAAAAFFGHLVAHDFTEIAPSIARALILSATRKLPKKIRQRYSEEWLADLNDRRGVLAKLGHSFGCVLCARRMRTQSIRAGLSKKKFRFQIGGVGIIELDFPTALFFVGLATHWMKSRNSSRPVKMARIAYGLAKHAFIFRNLGPIDFGKTARLVGMLGRIPDKKNPQFKAWVDGRQILPEKQKDTGA